MHRPTIPALAVLVLAAMAFPVLPEKLAAQTPDSANAGAVDPPDKVYSTGGLANDPAVDRSLPKIQEYRAFLPEKVDLSNRMPTVGDQGQLGSCGAWAVAYAARSYYTETQESRDIRKPSNLPSPNYVYHLSRPGNCDNGTNVDRVVAVLKQGSLSLADFPYTDACVPPAPASVVAQAHDFRVRGYSQVNIGRPDDIRGQLAKGNPVIIRFFVSTAFEKLQRHDVHRTGPTSRRQADRLAFHYTGRLRRASASIPSDQFLERALGRSWLRLAELRSVEDDAHQRRLCARCRRGEAPTHRQRTAATDTAAIASAGAAIAAAGAGRATGRPAKAVVRSRHRRSARRPIGVVRLRRQR